jgi:hypothetical protein
MSDSSDSLPLGLALQQAAKPIDPEQLELMGKRAAAAYSEHGTRLSDAVVEVVKEAKLSPEQVKRVCEFANTNAYLTEFEKAGEMRNVTFEGGPANPGTVLKDLNDGGNPMLSKVGSSDYAEPTGQYKTAGVSEDAFAEAFGIKSVGKEKTASAHSAVDRDQMSHYSPVDELNDLRICLEGTRETMISKLSSSGVVYDDVSSDLCKTAAQELETGTPMGDIARVWAGYAPSALLFKEAMSLVVKHLQTRGHSEEELAQSLNKMASAGVLPNPTHPLVEQFVAFTKVAHGHHVLQRSIEVLDEQLTTVRSKLHEMLS